MGRHHSKHLEQETLNSLFLFIFQDKRSSNNLEIFKDDLFLPLPKVIHYLIAKEIVNEQIGQDFFGEKLPTPCLFLSILYSTLSKNSNRYLIRL